MEKILNKEKYFDFDDISTISDEKYEYCDDNEVMRISKMLIDKHMEAYKALANA